MCRETVDDRADEGHRLSTTDANNATTIDVGT